MRSDLGSSLKWWELLAALTPLAAGARGAVPAKETSPILAAYDFEAPIASGPDTFWLGEREGSVDLSTAFAVGRPEPVRSLLKSSLVWLGAFLLLVASWMLVQRPG